MPSHTPSVAIIYGLNEGPAMGRQLRAALRQAGYRITRDAAHADTVIAHSGGCYLVPPPRSGQRIIMVGLPYWPGRGPTHGLGRKVWRDIRTHHHEGQLRFWLRKSFWNILYTGNLRQDLRMLAAWRRGAFWRSRNVTLVRYRNDPMTTPDVHHLPFTGPPRIIQIPGNHDDCWRDPAPIVRIVQS